MHPSTDQSGSRVVAGSQKKRLPSAPPRRVRTFTELFVRKAKPEPERFTVWGSSGLGLRVTPNGSKTWVFAYRHEERKRWLTLGRYPRMTVAEAHEAHGKALAEAERGVDPGAEKVKASQAHRDAPTITELVADYLELHAKPNKRSWREDERVLEREVVPHWGTRKAKDITRADVRELLARIVARGAPVQANRVLATVRKMFNWAIAEVEILEHSPCVAIKRPALEQQRTRVLTDIEMEKLVRELLGAPETAMSRPVRLALLLLLATGQRPGEVAGTAWSEMDRRGGWWTIPVERAKNGLSHRVPLSPFALARLEEARSLNPWVFPSLRGGKKPIAPTSLNQALRGVRERINAAEKSRDCQPSEMEIVAHFTAHDVRRSVATGLASMGHSRLVIGRILNHAETGSTRIYDRHGYDAQKKEALEAWGRRLEGWSSNARSKTA